MKLATSVSWTPIACCMASVRAQHEGGVMKAAMVRVLVWGILLLATQSAWAQNKCTAKGLMGGQAFDLASCEVAYFDSGHSVTIWFSSTPISAEERDAFQRSSSADRFRKGRSMVLIGFCPGGGSPTPSPKTAKSVEIGFKHATVPSLGPQDVWILEPATDKQIKVERLVGELKKGGRLAGKITGSIPGQKPPFNWDLDFDLSLPQTAAGAGPSC